MSSVLDVQLFLSVLVTLLVIMNPPGAVPIFLGLTASLTHKQRDVAARRAALVALGVIAAFALFGQQILTYLHISLPALQGAGGLLLLLVALQLLVGQESGVSSDAGVNVALVPLGTPILAGPGAIVATMLAVREANGFGGFLAVAGGLVIALLVVWLFLRFAGQVHRVLRDSGTMLVTRIAGLLLSAIAVQMIANSIRAFITTGS
ncbi:MAG TPA: MarC family protein [Dermatophilaceae bacterium]|jgi:multiple antibiotic resistance protein